jgi:hypothetical protein
MIVDTQPVILRKSNHVRRDGWEYPNEWVRVGNIQLIVNGPGNYLYQVDGIEYHSRTQEWRDKLSELQIWSKLCSITN